MAKKKQNINWLLIVIVGIAAVATLFFSGSVGNFALNVAPQYSEVITYDADGNQCKGWCWIITSTDPPGVELRNCHIGLCSSQIE